MQARRMLGLASCEQMTAAFSLPTIGLTGADLGLRG